MRTLIALACLLVLCLGVGLSAPSHAQSAADVFASPQSFEYVTTSTVFACNMRDANGNTYGTAHERTSRTVYRFRPDGTVSIEFSVFHAPSRATYSVVKRTVTIQHENSAGQPTSTQTLALSDDGKSLGELRLVGPPAQPAP